MAPPLNFFAASGAREQDDRRGWTSQVLPATSGALSQRQMSSGDAAAFDAAAPRSPPSARRGSSKVNGSQ